MTEPFSAAMTARGYTGCVETRGATSAKDQAAGSVMVVQFGEIEAEERNDRDAVDDAAPMSSAGSRSSRDFEDDRHERIALAGRLKAHGHKHRALLLDLAQSAHHCKRRGARAFPWAYCVRCRIVMFYNDGGGAIAARPRKREP